MDSLLESVPLGNDESLRCRAIYTPEGWWRHQRGEPLPFEVRSWDSRKAAADALKSLAAGPDAYVAPLHLLVPPVNGVGMKPI